MRRSSLAFLRILSLSVLPAAGCDGCGGGDIVVGAIDPVARCVATSGDVRRRLAMGAAWRSLDRNADLFAGDWVQTAERANARVVFDDGSKLFVEPSTTVVIERPGDRDEETGIRRIAVRSGAVRAGIGSGRRRRVQVRLPDGETISVAPRGAERDADVRIEVDDEGQAELAVTRGEVAVTTAAGETVDVLSGNAVRVDDGRTSPAEPLPVAPTLEPLGASSPHYVGAPISIHWASREPDRRFRIELSRAEATGPAFDRAIEAEASPVEWTPKAAATWVVRVFAMAPDGRRSPPSNRRRVEVVVDDRLRLLAEPPDGSVVRVPSGRARIEFSWKPHPEGGPYRLTIARDPELADVVETFDVDTPRRVARLAAGAYHWGVHRGPTALFVEPFRFRVARRGSDLRVPRKLDWSPRRR